MKTTFFFLLTSAALIVWPGQPAGADAPPRYRLTVLPLTFSGYNEVDFDDEHRSGINAQGQIVGSISVQSGKLRDTRIALWQNGQRLRILDKRPIIDVNATAGQDFLYATAINTRGETTGIRTISSSGAYTIRISTACILWNGRLNMLYQGFPSDTASAALGLNDQGDVVGGFVYDNTTADQVDSSAPPGTAGRHAFLRRRGHIFSLWQGVARGINNHRWIIGVKDIGYHDTHAKGVLWRSGHITYLKMQPVAINAGGEIAGNIPIRDDNGRACVWHRGRITLLSKNSNRAYALNNHGDVVGELWAPLSSHPTRAALWQRRHFYDLNRCVNLPRNWVIETATGINDNGWIIGQGSIYKTPKDKQPMRYFTFLLTPR